MTPLSGLELRRRVCELIGWRLEQVDNNAKLFTPDAIYKAGISGSINDTLNIAYLTEWMPKYEADASLSEALLMKVCDERGWSWAVYMNAAGGYTCSLWPAVGIGFMVDFNEDEWNEPLFTGSGKDPNEARARAIVEALSR